MSINRDDIKYYIDDNKFKNSINIVNTYYKRYLKRDSLVYAKF